MDDIIMLSSDEDSNELSIIKTVGRSPSECGALIHKEASLWSPRIDTSPPKATSSVTGLTSKIPSLKSARWTHALSDSDSSESDSCRRNNLMKEKQSSLDSDDDLPLINVGSFVPRTVSTNQTLKLSVDNLTPFSADVEIESLRGEMFPPSAASPLKANTSSDSEDIPQPKPKGKGRGQKVGPRAREEQQRLKKEAQIEKERRRKEAREERERKKQEAALTKELKQAYAEVSRSSKPRECLKLMKAILDPALLTSDFGGDLLTALKTSDIQYRIEELTIPSSIKWERHVVDVRLDGNKVCRQTRVEREAQVLVVWLWDHVVQLVHSHTLYQTVKDMLPLLPNCVITIAIYGLEEYFRVQKARKRKGVRANVLGTAQQRAKGKEAVFDAAPQVSRGDVEFALAELQILINVNHRCINSQSDLGNLVCQFSKALAEAPFKKEKRSKETEQLEWYALGDSKDCVPVDKDGNGLSRLWQQQLCQFALASIDTAEAIASVYPSPMSLIEAYEQCSNQKEAEQLLQDIPVRRGPGPLSTSRRIGPQLSRKICTFFTADDGDLPIGQD